ncbi:DUF7507 domain-containing protein [Lentiprolixibacter aurantiacus]|uniref:Gliding motility-associated C-terminal domain-containing protein n=1 Tax=Lentiprolixibacter aurantiacus TaxID=2993939 RepID=A0AAE3SN42_9FLAO|nr:gliding motility-associated C-terminal domain-containing protein [Lentiprolixibacter aurantiacus]MCX2719337.1 gliding motility-associated C-terminal domain-containing protein [Lentiprolixibacter aurantiacus]
MEQPLRQHIFWITLRRIATFICVVFLLGSTSETTYANTLDYNLPYADTDGDGVADQSDFDDDNDGVIDTTEDLNADGDNNPTTNPTDTDNDGIPDYLDVDSDNDGIIDNLEAQGVNYIAPAGVDADGNGLDDNYEETPGSCNGLEPVDTDGDGIPDYRDIDSDNDGILDNIEAQSAGFYEAPSGEDANGNGLDDAYESNGEVCDYNGPDTKYKGKDKVTLCHKEDKSPNNPRNGFHEITVAPAAVRAHLDHGDKLGPCGSGYFPDLGLSPLDTDGDGHPDFRDIDSDNDGILDNVEAQDTESFQAPCGVDSDGNGLDDHYENSPGSGEGITPINSDSDSYPNFRDIDSDDDGIPDNVEAQTTAGYIPPTGQDSDNDGLDDAYEGSGDEGITPVNTDGTDEVDYLDADTDNDLVADNNEGNDFNFDGIPDQQYTGTDTDGDGLDDGYEGSDVNDGFDVNDEIDDPANDLPDTDGTEDVNYRDIDDDGDGIDTPDEDVDEDGDPTNDDSDEDGTPDYLDPDTPNGPDTDDDGVPDAIDIDDDNDGILDTVEDPNLDGDDDPLTDPLDSDGDGKPDHLDIDSDDDGIPDNVEAQTTAGYIPPTGQDGDNDGLDDAYEGSGDEGITPVNTDGTDEVDYLDADTDNDLVADNNEGNDFNFDGIPDQQYTGTDTDGDGLDDGYEGSDVNDGFDVNDEIDDPANDLPDTDGTEDVNYRDIDDDGDGIDTPDEDVDDDGDPTNDDSDEDGTPDYLDPFVASPNITLTKVDVFNDENGDLEYQAGETISYIFTVTNTGNISLENITVTDPLVTVSGGPLASLGPGESDNTTFTAVYTISQQDLDSGNFTNSATVSADIPDGEPISSLSDDPDDPTDRDIDGDGNPDDPTVTDFGTPPVMPNITLLKVDVFNDENGNGEVQPGETISYIFTVTNTGNITLSNITVTDPLVTVTGGPIASLEPGESDSTTFTAVYTITAEDIQNGSFTNSATVFADVPDGETISSLSDDPDNPTDRDIDGDGNPDDPTVTDFGDPPLGFAGITLLKIDTFNDENGDGIFQAGETISYTFVVTNTGTITLSNIEVTDPLVNVSGGPIATLEPRESDSTTFTASYTLTQQDIENGSFSNSAFVMADVPDGDPISSLSDDPDNPTDEDSDGDGNPDDPTVTSIEQVASVSLLKAADSPTFSEAGETVTYTLTVINTGNLILQNLVVSDPNAIITSGSPVSALNPGETATVTAEHQITAADVSTGVFINTATVDGDSAAGAVTDDSDDPNNPTDFDANDDGEPDDPTVINLDTSSVEIEVNQMVTPNGDGRNDFLFIRGVQAALNNSLKIYNRWGVVVYEGNNYNNLTNVFDGRSRGRSTISVNDYLPAGVYFYIFEYQRDQKNITDKGYLYISQ